MKEDIEAWERFLWILEWVLSLEIRYSGALHYSLVKISFHDMNTLGNAYGANWAVYMLVDTASRLRTTFRKTDLVARNGTDIWVLLPCATHEIVLEKIAKVVEVAAENGLDIVDRDVSIYEITQSSLLNKDRQFESPLDFLDFISDKKDIAMRWSRTTGLSTTSTAD